MTALLELSGVSKSFRRGGVLVPAVKNVSLSIGQGEIVALVGGKRLRQVDAGAHRTLPDRA